jgi:hypothetical protein
MGSTAVLKWHKRKNTAAEALAYRTEPINPSFDTPRARESQVVSAVIHEGSLMTSSALVLPL